MKKMAMVVVLGIFVLAPLLAEAYPSGDKAWGECAKCHKLEKKEAEKIVKKFVKGGTFLGVKPGPLKGFWAIEVEKEGQRGGILVDFSKTYLVGQIYPLKPPERKVDFSKISFKDAVVLGPKTAKHKVVVFTDPDCPFCRKFHEEMKKVLEKRSDIAFYIMLFPLDMHKEAYKKAQAVLCEKSTALLDDAFAGKAVPEPTCSSEPVERNKALAQSLEITGTPAIIREDGMLVSGYLEVDDLLEWIERKK